MWYELIKSMGAILSFSTLGILISLIALEIVLSADNAMALAALVQHLENSNERDLALNCGLGLAFILRITLILTSTWVIQFWQFELLGSFYLLWLSGKYFWQRFWVRELNFDAIESNNYQSNWLWQIIPAIALTDLAFSLDSVTTAVALSSKVFLILAGGIIGVIALRFLAELFVQWLTEFTYLEDAAYLTIFFVGMRLFAKVLVPVYVIPEWLMIISIITLFSWGFSKRVFPQVATITSSYHFEKK
ncbi:Integral membrane protein TerC [Stanieria sp. NIES-3757]|nr:Integral membrane protein TerC [Stanieria sp. NIES-3757]